jgi:hypothetical protein
MTPDRPISRRASSMSWWVSLQSGMPPHSPALVTKELLVARPALDGLSVGEFSKPDIGLKGINSFLLRNRSIRSIH